MPKKRGRSIRSRRWKAMTEKVGSTATAMTVSTAVQALKDNPHKAKFDETVDLAIKLDIDTKQADQNVRGAFSLPKGIGKTMRVIVFCEGDLAAQCKAAGATEAGNAELVKKVLDGWLDFDVAIAHPSTMREVGKLGRVLGPQGKMPSPKSGTVTPNVVQATKEFAGGKIEYRTDSFGNIHVPVGKMSFSGEDIQANVEAMINHIRAVRPASVKGVYIKKVTLSSTMGPGLRIACGE